MVLPCAADGLWAAARLHLQQILEMITSRFGDVISPEQLSIYSHYFLGAVVRGGGIEINGAAMQHLEKRKHYDQCQRTRVVSKLYFQTLQ